MARVVIGGGFKYNMSIESDKMIPASSESFGSLADWMSLLASPFQSIAGPPMHRRPRMVRSSECCSAGKPGPSYWPVVVAELAGVMPPAVVPAAVVV